MLWCPLLTSDPSSINISKKPTCWVRSPDEAQFLADHIGAIFDEDQIRLARLGPTLGVNAGPGALVVALRGKRIR